MSKSAIFDFFYQRQSSSRSGGGKIKKKMSRVSVSCESMITMESNIIQNRKLHNYYLKLRDRKSNIAPPPRPNN